MMKTSFAAMLVAAVIVISGPVGAASVKESECKFQGSLMATVQKARLNGVSQAKLTEVVTKDNPDLPQSVVNVIPALGSHVYGMKRRDLKKVDLGAVAEAQCLENWDQIQAMKKTLKN